MSRRAHYWNRGFTACVFCNAPFSQRENNYGRCRGGPLRGKRKQAAKKGSPKVKQSHNYRRSRFALDVGVRVKQTGEVGVVAGHVRRKIRWREQNQWRQTPVVRFNGGKSQKVIDDDELEAV